MPYNEENLKKFVAQVPLARLTEPIDVANLALYLASDEGKFTTGQNLVLDGGKVSRVWQGCCTRRPAYTHAGYLSERSTMLLDIFDQH